MTTEPSAVPEARRYQAHADLFDQLSKLRAFLSLLYAGSFDHFRSLDESLQAEILWTCLSYAEGAYTALTIWNGIDTQEGADLH